MEPSIILLTSEMERANNFTFKYVVKIIFWNYFKVNLIFAQLLGATREDAVSEKNDLDEYFTFKSQIYVD